MNKRKKMGIDGKICVWIHNFLWTTSSKAQVKSLQISVLDPLLFPIHISDIDKEISDSTVSYFADDTQILRGTRDEKDTQMIQKDLHNLYITS